MPLLPRTSSPDCQSKAMCAAASLRWKNARLCLALIFSHSTVTARIEPHAHWWSKVTCSRRFWLSLCDAHTHQRPSCRYVRECTLRWMENRRHMACRRFAVSARRAATKPSKAHVTCMCMDTPPPPYLVVVLLQSGVRTCTLLVLVHLEFHLPGPLLHVQTWAQRQGGCKEGVGRGRHDGVVRVKRLLSYEPWKQEEQV